VEGGSNRLMGKKPQGSALRYGERCAIVSLSNGFASLGAAGWVCGRCGSSLPWGDDFNW
jgi:hypothetical protein